MLFIITYDFRIRTVKISDDMAWHYLILIEEFQTFVHSNNIIRLYFLQCLQCKRSVDGTTADNQSLFIHISLKSLAFLLYYLLYPP